MFISVTLSKSLAQHSFRSSAKKCGLNFVCDSTELPGSILRRDAFRSGRMSMFSSMIKTGSDAAIGKSTAFSTKLHSTVKDMETDYRKLEVVKRPSDNREYRAFRLDNGMSVLLVSDSAASRGAAAIAVHVGSFSDPKDIPGLAHFAEHMCFLGTQKYPQEDDFSKFLASHGGSSNAYTSSEDTVYYFDCSANYLGDALDRFSQFFSAPLFAPSATARELNAIESEVTLFPINPL